MDYIENNIKTELSKKKINFDNYKFKNNFPNQPFNNFIKYLVNELLKKFKNLDEKDIDNLSKTDIKGGGSKSIYELIIRKLHRDLKIHLQNNKYIEKSKLCNYKIYDLISEKHLSISNPIYILMNSVYQISEIIKKYKYNSTINIIKNITSKIGDDIEYCSIKPVFIEKKKKKKNSAQKSHITINELAQKIKEKIANNLLNNYELGQLDNEKEYEFENIGLFLNF